jgi:hypothetical protein
MRHSNGGTAAAVERTVLFAAALMGASLCAAASPPAAAAGSGEEAGVWVQKEINFRYVGFTTKYSCDGLQDKMRHFLLLLGARDIKIAGYGCVGANSPETTPGVRVIMHVLQPASAGAEQSVAAHWQSVDLLAGRDPFDAARDCELISQLDRDVLPLFAVRDVEYSATCSVHTPLVGGTRLKAAVLVADSRAATASR